MEAPEHKAELLPKTTRRVSGATDRRTVWAGRGNQHGSHQPQPQELKCSLSHIHTLQVPGCLPPPQEPSPTPAHRALKRGREALISEATHRPWAPRWPFLCRLGGFQSRICPSERRTHASNPELFQLSLPHRVECPRGSGWSAHPISRCLSKNAARQTQPGLAICLRERLLPQSQIEISLHLCFYQGRLALNRDVPPRGFSSGQAHFSGATWEERGRHLLCVQEWTGRKPWHCGFLRATATRPAENH